jgi:HPt (histidine-containing phosphotransfer) domain-containing protein
MSSTAPTGQTGAYLDIARALEQIGDAEAMRSMLPMLQELLDRDVPEIARLIGAGDARSANALLHSLKGCMPIFCGPELCRELTTVEMMSKTATAAEVSPAFAALHPKLQGLQREVALYLASPDGR